MLVANNVQVSASNHPAKVIKAETPRTPINSSNCIMSSDNESSDCDSMLRSPRPLPTKLNVCSVYWRLEHSPVLTLRLDKAKYCPWVLLPWQKAMVGIKDDSTCIRSVCYIYMHFWGKFTYKVFLDANAPEAIVTKQESTNITRPAKVRPVAKAVGTMGKGKPKQLPTTANEEEVPKALSARTHPYPTQSAGDDVPAARFKENGFIPGKDSKCFATPPVVRYLPYHSNFSHFLVALENHAVYMRIRRYKGN